MALEDQFPELLQPAIQLFGSAFAFLQSYAGNEVMNLLILAGSIALYAIIVGKFYKKLSKRELFTSDIAKRSEGFAGFVGQMFRAVWLIIKYSLAFPIITFLWFLFLASFLFFLSRTQAVEGVLVVSIAVIIAIRVSAYIDEDIAVDLAKMLPLGMLGVYLTDPAVFSRQLLVERLTELARLIPTSLSFFYVLIISELVLKITYGFKRWAFGSKEEAK